MAAFTAPHAYGMRPSSVVYDAFGGIKPVHGPYSAGNHPFDGGIPPHASIGARRVPQHAHHGSRNPGSSSRHRGGSTFVTAPGAVYAAPVYAQHVPHSVPQAGGYGQADLLQPGAYGPAPPAQHRSYAAPPAPQHQAHMPVQYAPQGGYSRPAAVYGQPPAPAPSTYPRLEQPPALAAAAGGTFAPSHGAPVPAHFPQYPAAPHQQQQPPVHVQQVPQPQQYPGHAVTPSTLVPAQSSDHASSASCSVAPELSKIALASARIALATGKGEPALWSSNTAAAAPAAAAEWPSASTGSRVGSAGSQRASGASDDGYSVASTVSLPAATSSGAQSGGHSAAAAWAAGHSFGGSSGSGSTASSVVSGSPASASRRGSADLHGPVPLHFGGDPAVYPTYAHHQQQQVQLPVVGYAQQQHATYSQAYPQHHHHQLQQRTVAPPPFGGIYPAGSNHVQW